MLRPFARGLSDVFVAVAVVVPQAPIIHAGRSYSWANNIQETNVMFNVNVQEEFMEREIKLRPLLKHASYHNWKRNYNLYFILVYNLNNKGEDS